MLLDHFLPLAFPPGCIPNNSMDQTALQKQSLVVEEPKEPLDIYCISWITVFA